MGGTPLSLRGEWRTQNYLKQEEYTTCPIVPFVPIAIGRRRAKRRGYNLKYHAKQ